jgi:hypothetical protein
MANVLDQNPLILDTTGTLVITGPIAITKIRWIVDAGVAENDEAILKDANGDVIFRSKTVEAGTAANQLFPEDVNFIPPLRKTGLTVDTLAADTVLHVYYDSATPLKTT